MSWFKKLKDGLSKSSKKVSESLASLPSLSALVGKSKLDAASLEEVEDALIAADLGTASSIRLAAALKAHKFTGPVDAGSIALALAEGLETILEPVAKPLEIKSENRPHVVLLVGVNGSGKTTTAGKLAQNWQSQGKKVLLAAGDTFRAAAIEQLQIWGQRTGTAVIGDATGGDAAALVYRALAQAIEENADVLIIDTAGRPPQNRTELMDELSKIVRVIRKLDKSAPHDLSYRFGWNCYQNALSQVKAFSAVADVTGLIVTKLDGSAKGGVVVALAEEFGLPVHAVGVGEGADDLQPFAADEFARAIAGIGAD